MEVVSRLFFKLNCKLYLNLNYCFLFLLKQHIKGKLKVDLKLHFRCLTSYNINSNYPICKFTVNGSCQNNRIEENICICISDALCRNPSASVECRTILFLYLKSMSDTADGQESICAEVLMEFFLLLYLK